jgi:hypothetical protein
MLEELDTKLRYSYEAATVSKNVAGKHLNLSERLRP